MQFADPKNDLAFKKIFSNENRKDILISFLNSILDFKEQQIIVDVTIANPYQVPKIPELKETILDIKATNKNGEQFIVELQRKDLGDFSKRSLYYTSKAYVEQLDKKQIYSSLKKVYFIGILNFNVFENDSYISRHLIMNQETNTQDIKDFEFSFIELKKFNKDLSQLNTILDKWIYFIKNASSLELVPKEFKEIKEFTQAFDIATQTAWDKKELEVYEYMALKEYDEINALQTATKKGIEEGMAKGIEQGIAKGRKAQKIEIAKNLLDLLDSQTIALKTGLSVLEIEELKESR